MTKPKPKPTAEVEVARTCDGRIRWFRSRDYVPGENEPLRREPEIKVKEPKP